MSNSDIDYVTKGWNPVIGCEKLSDGCKHCWAMKMAWRLANIKKTKSLYGPTVEKRKDKVVWTGKPQFNKKALLEPFKWKTPQVAAVSFMGDLFHDDVADEWIIYTLAVMLLCPQHKFLILTKRADRMRAFFEPKSRGFDNLDKIWRCAADGSDWRCIKLPDYFYDLFDSSLPDHIFFGVSVEQRKHLSRIDALRAIPCMKRWVSFEPMLESLGELNLKDIHWAVAGGLSKGDPDILHPSAVRELQGQCKGQGVPFYFKPWGDWIAHSQAEKDPDILLNCLRCKKQIVGETDNFYCVGTSAAGNLLDGQKIEEFPVGWS